MIITPPKNRQQCLEWRIFLELTPYCSNIRWRRSWFMVAHTAHSLPPRKQWAGSHSSYGIGWEVSLEISALIQCLRTRYFISVSTICLISKGLVTGTYFYILYLFMWSWTDVSTILSIGAYKARWKAESRLKSQFQSLPLPKFHSLASRISHPLQPSSCTTSVLRTS